MDKETMDDIVEKALREDGGECLWARLNGAALASSTQEGGLFHDPDFAKEVQRFMEKNRLPLAASISRHALRRGILRLRLLLNGKSAAKSCDSDSSAHGGAF